MRNLTILLASAALVASTAIASAQSPKEQTPAVSPAQTQQKPGGADGGLGPNETSKSGQTLPQGANAQMAPKSGTTGAGVKNDPNPGSGQAAPSGGSQGGSAAAPSIKPTEPSRSTK